MLQILRLVRPAWRRLAGAAALGTLATACGVALLAVSAWLITRAAGMPVVLTLMVAIVGVRTFGIGRAVFRYAERLVAHDAALRALVEVRVRLFRALERLAPSQYWGAGDLLQRLSADVDALADLLIRGWLPLISSAVVLTCGVTILGGWLPAAAWSALIALLVTVFIASLVAVRSVALETEIATVQLARTGVIAETIQAAADPAVLLGSGWRAELDRIDADEERLGAALGRWSGAASAAAVAAFGVAVAACWWLGRTAEVSGETLAILVLLPLALTDVALMVSPALTQLQRGRLAGRQILEMLRAGSVDLPDRTSVATPTESAAAISIRVRNLQVQWPEMDRPALSGIDLDLAPGRRIAVVGPSGSGKSTLLAALLDFAPVTGGSIEVNGQAAGSRRDVMALCDQQGYLFDSSILQNVRLARSAATDDDVLAALRAAQLGDWIQSLPKGARTRVGHLGAMISGGQRQRIAFARALLANRPILLLDEPTAGLDQPTGRALIREMVNAGPDVCVVLVTHELDQLAGFDQVVELRGGAAVVGAYPTG